MLDRLIEAKGQNNIFVFPERIQCSFIFSLIRVIHNINEGKIAKGYNPESFVKGEKLKLGNCVVAFNRIESKNGKPYLFWLDNADCTSAVPIGMIPLLQRTNTKRGLSKDLLFWAEKERLQCVPQKDKQLVHLASYKTHIESSIFYIAPITSTKEQLFACKLRGRNISDFLFIGQANYKGEIRNIGAGQLSGIPSLILASDLYAIYACAEKGAPIQSVIVDVLNPNIIESQLDVLDDLIRLGFPIVCIMDTVNSFDLQPLLDRGFNIWRWDESSITEDLYNISTISGFKIKNCVKRKIEYITANDIEISDSLRKLNTHKAEVQGQSPQMINLFDKLFSLTFFALRAITPIDESEREQIQNNLNIYESDISKEKVYISEDAYDDYKKVISNLKNIFAPMFNFPKLIALQNHLKENKYRAICILIPDKTDKQSTIEYWRAWCSQQSPHTNITVLYPSEYYNISDTSFSTTIIVGWLNSTIMKKIIYGFNTESHVILLYEYENRWKNSHLKRWNHVLSSTNNKTIIKNFFNMDRQEILISDFQVEGMAAMDPEVDELEEIELVLRENKYHKYTSGKQRASDETTEAIPVNYVGGLIAFYKTSHRIITATDIIINDDEKINMKLPSQIQVGDFVIVREAGKDLIKELADTILGNSGKHGCRELATKWKESLTIECIFSSHEEIYKKLKATGCTKNFQTVHGWITDEDIIAPQQKDDLLYIAQVTEDAVLLEMIDQVFEAAREVKSAHVQAGKHLSEQLKKKVASALREFGEIDPYNIWDPIVLSLEGVGTIKILKVIDIGPKIIVDTADTNRLIEEA
jgi:hypothetical protein